VKPAINLPLRAKQFSNKNMVLAPRLADESRAYAQLASAKAEAAKAKLVNDDMQKSNVTLKQEMQRNTDGQQ
jgi:hypothetical protein